MVRETVLVGSASREYILIILCAWLTINSLAYVEMRLVLSRVLFEFDLELTGETKDWDQTKIWLVYKKNPLWVKLKPVA